MFDTSLYPHPGFVCDQCRKEIKAAADGNYYWPDQGRRSPLWFTHKGDCSFAFERADPARAGWLVTDLDELLVELVVGLKVDVTEARR
jgi:hypothetical protein